MVLGFNVFTDDNNKLAYAIADSKHTKWFEPQSVSDILIRFIEYDFYDYDFLIKALYELPIFKEYVDGDADDFESTLDVNYEDYEQCVEMCYDIADGLTDPIGSFFTCKELDKINAKPDDDSASYWIYQSRAMVDALREPIRARVFISHAFEICFGDTVKADLSTRTLNFFNRHVDLYNHTFLESFDFFPGKDGRIDYERTVALKSEMQGDFNRFFDVIHKGKNQLSIVKGNVIRTYKELMFFLLLELLRHDVRIQRCQYCSSYFVPKTKKKTLYCDRVIKDDKTCKDIAPKAKHMANKQEYGALREYDRLYKMYYARAERYEGRIDYNREKTDNDLTFEEFFEWSAKAANARIRYVSDKISAEEFIKTITIEEKK